MTRRGIFIEEFMLEPGLKLKGCALLLYALIYSYTINHKEMYEKEASLAKRLCYTREMVAKTLNKLVKDGLIIRKNELHTPGNTHVYIADLSRPECEINSHLDVKKVHTGMRNNFTSACDNTSRNNIKEDIKDYNYGKKFSLFSGTKIPGPGSKNL